MNKAIVIDAECFVPIRGGTSLSFYQALYKLSELVKTSGSKQPKIYLCSSRNRAEVEFLAHFIGFPYTWAVIENGARLLDLTTGEVLLSPFLFGQSGLFYFIYRKKVPKILKKHNGLSLMSGFSSCISFERNPGSVLAIEELCRGVKRELAPFIKKRQIRVTHSEGAEGVISIVPKGISKSTGVRFLAHCCDIDIQRSLGIGLSRRDISFVRRFGMIGCPSNANEEMRRYIKIKRGRVSSFPFVGGVVDVIEYYKDCF